jgi:hypothetical protein
LSLLAFSVTTFSQWYWSVQSHSASVIACASRAMVKSESGASNSRHSLDHLQTKDGRSSECSRCAHSDCGLCTATREWLRLLVHLQWLREDDRCADAVEWFRWLDRLRLPANAVEQYVEDILEASRMLP